MSVISAPIPSYQPEQMKKDLEHPDALEIIPQSQPGRTPARKRVEFASFEDRLEYRDPRYAPPGSVCGIKRRVFWIVVAFVVLLNVGTIAGLVVVKSKDGDLFAGGRKVKDNDGGNVTSHSAKGGEDVKTFKGLPLLPGTPLAATNWDDQTRVYYQNGDGNIVQSYCAQSCTPAQNPIITDAKYFSPLESVGMADHNSSIHIFYLTTSNILREKLVSKSGNLTDGPLSTFTTPVHSESDISATFSSEGSIKLYYQDAATLRIRELIYTPGIGWANGSQLLPAAPGSHIATAHWEDNLRVYFVNESSVLIEQKWASANGWSLGTSTGREIDQEAALTAVPPKDPAANPTVRLYSTNSYNELFTFTEKDSQSRKTVIGSVREVFDDITAVQSRGGRVSIWFVDREGDLMLKSGDGENGMNGRSVRVAAKEGDPAM